MLSDQLKAVLSHLPTGQLQEVVEYAQRLLDKRCNPGPEEGLQARAGSFDRKHERVDCNFQATFIRHMAPPDPATGKMGLQDASVHDISQGGICMRTRQALAVGEVLTVFLKSESRVEKRLFIEVRRCDPRGEEFEVGGMFVAQSVVIAAERTRLLAGRSSS